MVSPIYPRRTKRRRQTRNKIVNAAAELFALHGYEPATMEMIAARADVHVQTLYRHFPRGKEELAMAPDWTTYETFAEKLNEKEREGTTFQFWRDWVESRGRTLMSPGIELFLKRVQLRETVPALSVSYLRLSHTWEDALTESFAGDFNLDPSIDSFPRILACTL